MAEQQPPPAGYPYPQQPMMEPRNGFGLTALILGILGLLFGLVPFTGFIAFGLGAVGLIFGLANIGRLKRRRSTNKVTTGFGIGLSALAIVAGVIGMTILFGAFEDLSDDLSCIEQAETVEEMEECN